MPPPVTEEGVDGLASGIVSIDGCWKPILDEFQTLESFLYIFVISLIAMGSFYGKFYCPIYDFFF